MPHMGKNSAPADEPISADEAAGLMRLTPQYVRQLARNGKIPAREVAGVWVFRRGDVLAWKPERGRGRPKTDAPKRKARKPPPAGL
jgi:excisionase family DNA binding protein